MAYRKIHNDFWTDPDMEDLTPEQKFFYLYLITNPNVNQIGLYEFSVKRASFETGYDIDTVSKLLDTFKKLGKIRCSTKTKEILVVKVYWHNKSNSPKMKKHVEGLLKAVKDTSLIQYIYGMERYINSIDTASQEEEEKKEEEKEEEKKEEEPTPSKNEKPKPKFKPPDSLLSVPEFEKTWIEWEKHRRRIGKKMTQRAAELIWMKLERWDDDPVEVLNQSIENGWTGIFELKNQSNGKTNTTQKFDTGKVDEEDYGDSVFEDFLRDNPDRDPLRETGNG